MGAKMKAIWVMICGWLLVLYSFSMDTTVSYGSEQIHNLAKASQQQNTLILGLGIFFVGLILFALHKIKQTPEEESKEKVETEVLVVEMLAKADLAKDRVGDLINAINPVGYRLYWRLFIGLYVGVCNFFLFSYLGLWVLIATKNETLIDLVVSVEINSGVVGFVGVLVYAFRKIPASNVMQHLLFLNMGLSALICSLWVGMRIREPSSFEFLITELFPFFVPILISYGLLWAIQRSDKLK